MHPKTGKRTGSIMGFVQVAGALGSWAGFGFRSGGIERRPWANRLDQVPRVRVAAHFLEKIASYFFETGFEGLEHSSAVQSIYLECVANKARGDPQARPETTTLLAGSSFLVVDREKERRPACVGINPPGNRRHGQKH